MTARDANIAEQPAEDDGPGSITRQTFIARTAAFALPALADAQKPTKAPTSTVAPPRVKPYLMAQLGHSADVMAVAFSPDGKYGLTASMDVRPFFGN